MLWITKKGKKTPNQAHNRNEASKLNRIQEKNKKNNENTGEKM